MFCTVRHVHEAAPFVALRCVRSVAALLMMMLFHSAAVRENTFGITITRRLCCYCFARISDAGSLRRAGTCCLRHMPRDIFCRLRR